MLVTFDGILMDVNFDAPENVLAPILVTPDGMVMEVNANAPWNALAPILVTPDGMVMEVNADAPKNAFAPMLVYPEINTFDILLLIKLAFVTIACVSSPLPGPVNS